MKSYSNLTATTYFLIRKTLKPIIKGVWVKKVTGLHNIPKSGPAIIALNHQSFFDFLIFSVISSRNVHFLTAEKFFQHKLWRPLMLLTGQIKVDRTSKDKERVHALVESHLKKGNLVAIFPEGTRSHLKDEMLKAFTGIGKYALEHKVPIIPIGVIGTYDILAKNTSKIAYKKIAEIHIGEPLHFKEHWGKHNDKQICTYVTEKVIKRIEILSGKKYPHYEHVDIE